MNLPTIDRGLTPSQISQFRMKFSRTSQGFAQTL